MLIAFSSEEELSVQFSAIDVYKALPSRLESTPFKCVSRVEIYSPTEV